MLCKAACASHPQPCSQPLATAPLPPTITSRAAGPFPGFHIRLPLLVRQMKTQAGPVFQSPSLSAFTFLPLPIHAAAEVWTSFLSSRRENFSLEQGFGAQLFWGTDFLLSPHWSSYSFLCLACSPSSEDGEGCLRNPRISACSSASCRRRAGFPEPGIYTELEAPLGSIPTTPRRAHRALCSTLYLYPRALRSSLL